LGVIGAAVVVVMAFGVRDASAGVAAGMATEWTQILNNVALVEQYSTQLQQAATQIQQFQTEVQRTQAMTQGLMNGNFNFGLLASDLAAINGAVSYGNAMSYTMGNLDSEFQQRYPGYGGVTPTNYSQQYQSWYNTNLDT